MATESQISESGVGGDRSKLKTGFLVAQPARLGDFLHSDFLPLALRSLGAGRERLVQRYSWPRMRIASRWAKELGMLGRRHFKA